MSINLTAGNHTQSRWFCENGHFLCPFFFSPDFNDARSKTCTPRALHICRRLCVRVCVCVRVSVGVPVTKDRRYHIFMILQNNVGQFYGYEIFEMPVSEP